MNVKDGPPHGDAGGAPARGARTAHRTPEDHAMRLQKLKHMVEVDAYRVDPHAVALASALLLRVDPRRDLFTGLLTPPDGRSPAGRAARSGRAG